MKSGIRDNRTRGKVAEFLKEKAASGSRLSVVSAYFTMYAYEALSDQIDSIESLKFLFGESPLYKAEVTIALDLIRRLDRCCP